MKPKFFMYGEIAFDWQCGLPSELPREKTLVRAQGINFHTWIDDNGERNWKPKKGL